MSGKLLDTGKEKWPAVALTTSLFCVTTDHELHRLYKTVYHIDVLAPCTAAFTFVAFNLQENAKPTDGEAINGGSNDYAVMNNIDVDIEMKYAVSLQISLSLSVSLFHSLSLSLSLSLVPTPPPQDTLDCW